MIQTVKFKLIYLECEQPKSNFILLSVWKMSDIDATSEKPHSRILVLMSELVSWGFYGMPYIV